MDPSAPSNYVSAEAPVASVIAQEYTSNPFPLVIKSLGRMLEINGTSSLLAVVRYVIAALLAVIVLVALSFLLAMAQLSTVMFLVFALLYLAIIAMAVALYSAITAAGVNDIHYSGKELFSQAQAKLLPVVGLTVLTGLIVIVGLVLLVVPGIIFALWFCLAPAAMFTENLGIVDSLKRSKQLVSGHLWEMWGMMTAATILGSNGLLSFLVVPSALAGRYRQLRDLKASGQSKPPVHWANYVLPLVMVVIIGLYVVVVVMSMINNSNQPTNIQVNSNGIYNTGK
jgi:hypothetical protein